MPFKSSLPETPPQNFLEPITYTDGMHLFSINDSIEIEYPKNNYGYRSDDFSEENAKSSILAVGCSVTYGTGLPSEYMWPNMLKKLLGHKTFASMASPGRPIEIIANDVYNYIRKFGKPAAVVMLLPDIRRYYRIEEYKDRTTFRSLLLHHLPQFKKDKDFPIQDQKSLDYINTIITEHNLMYNLVSRVTQLEDFLKAISVPFVYSTWNNSVLSYLSTYKDSFSNFVEYKLVDKDRYIYETMDEATNDLEKQLWAAAADTKTNTPHPGIGEQKFYAKLFYDALKNISSP